MTSAFTSQTKHVFSDNIFMGGNSSTNCEVLVHTMVPGQQQGLIPNSCTDSRADGSSEYTGQLSTAALHQGCSWNSALGALSCPDGYSSLNASALIPGAACPLEVDGNQVLQDPSDLTRFFLKMAVEIPGDDIGNDNGLCESGERCLYAPPFQKITTTRGPGLTEPCVFANGHVKNVIMY
jgi:hypothetical protein